MLFKIKFTIILINNRPVDFAEPPKLYRAWNFEFNLIHMATTTWKNWLSSYPWSDLTRRILQKERNVIWFLFCLQFNNTGTEKEKDHRKKLFMELSIHLVSYFIVFGIKIMLNTWKPTNLHRRNKNWIKK